MGYNICPNCFQEVSAFVCPHCGYDRHNAKQFEDALPPETILGARYLLGRVLGKGGFGITYLGKDLVTERIVAIKECMPEVYSYRAMDNCLYPKKDCDMAFSQCMECFHYEIEALKMLEDNPYVVDVLDAFAENRTVYFIMEYIDGVSLKILTNSNEGKISQSNAGLVIFTVGSALMEVHKKGIIHRDISPENIMIDRKGEIKLIDFGAAKNYYDKSYFRNESLFLKPGFAPLEQYSLDGNQGPWTDVYALAATFYTSVSGKPLVDSETRSVNDTMKPLSELDCGISEAASAVISHALAIMVHDRYASVSEFLDALVGCIDMSETIDNRMLGKINLEKENENRFGDNDNHTRGMKLPSVEIMNGKAAGKKISIPEFGFVSLGRAEDNAIQINDDEDISRHHALIGFDRVHKRFIVIDRSANGTFYSNQRKMMHGAESFLAENDVFYICENGVKVRVFMS